MNQQQTKNKLAVYARAGRDGMYPILAPHETVVLSLIHKPLIRKTNHPKQIL